MKAYFWRALALCGTLDIVYAALLSLIGGGSVAGMLGAVASGPFGAAASHWGTGGAVVGLLVHYGLMAAMVALYGLIASRIDRLRRTPLVAGVVYGVALYLVMYWIVLPLRWPTIHPDTDPATIASALFAHVALVGVPMAFLARRHLAGQAVA